MSEYAKTENNSPSVSFHNETPDVANLLSVNTNLTLSPVRHLSFQQRSVIALLYFDMTPYSLVDRYQRFGRTCCLCSQFRLLRLTVDAACFYVRLVGTYLPNYMALHPTGQQCSAQLPIARWFPARVIFDPEDGGDTFLRNVGSHTDYTEPITENGNIQSYTGGFLRP
jgi:hypothetical protein